MPSRIHWSGKNNRSQHSLVGPTVAEDSATVPVSAAANAPGASASAANPPSASPNPALSSSESFQPDTSAGRGNHAQPPPPPPHLVNIYGTAAGGPNPANSPPQLQHSNSVSAAFDSRQREHDFADQVTRSQSHRFTQLPPTPGQLHLQQQQQPQPQHPLQQQAQPHPGSASFEDLSATAAHGNISSPVLAGPPQPIFGHQHPQPPPAHKPKQSSTRTLIKNILRGSDHPPQTQQNPYSSSSGPARRNSKRVSLVPPYPNIRTSVSQFSQVSLDHHQQHDWRNQGPPTQPSPLQGVRDFRETYVIDGSDQELPLQNPQDTQHPSIRPVPPSGDTSPYAAEDIAYHQQQRAHPQGHVPAPPEVQHQQYGQAIGQAIFDANPHQPLPPPPPQQQYQFASPQQGQYPGSTQPSFSQHLGAPKPQNPETVSQLSHESPVTDSDLRSATDIPQAQTAPPPTINYPSQTQDIPGHQDPPPPAQALTPQQQTMAPPAGGPPPPARRSQDAEKGLRDQVQPPPGPPPSYRQSQQGNMNPLPQPPNAAAQNPTFRRSDVPDRQQPFDGPADVQGRNSPQPPPSDRGAEDPEKAFKDLLTKYKNVKRLYFDGKKEIEHLNSQIEQLQNAVANQRMSQSRTSLDDNEYATRFNRLNGAINNLSFNIRKDWVTLPAWLVPFVSADALKTGKQEMTAVGRAVITRWIVEEIFNRSFHPGLDAELSRQLKIIEHNIRAFSYTMSSQEEFDALTNKVVAWRMTTLDGLQDVLRSGEAVENRNDFTRRATSNLTACLFQHLADPPPAGVDGSASMIVELAVGIACNMPLESRDVAIVYPLPEQPIQPDLMEVEKTGLPPLEPRAPDASEEAAVADDVAGGAAKDAAGAKDGGAKDRRADKLRTVPAPLKDQAKVRFAGFVAVEVRGRQVLVKAPVWTLA